MSTYLPYLMQCLIGYPCTAEHVPSRVVASSNNRKACASPSHSTKTAKAKEASTITQWMNKEMNSDICSRGNEMTQLTTSYTPYLPLQQHFITCNTSRYCAAPKYILIHRQIHKHRQHHRPGNSRPLSRPCST